MKNLQQKKHFKKLAKLQEKRKAKLKEKKIEEMQELKEESESESGVEEEQIETETTTKGTFILKLSQFVE